jgi:hypothetical protein
MVQTFDQKMRYELFRHHQEEPLEDTYVPTQYMPNVESYHRIGRPHELGVLTPRESIRPESKPGQHEPSCA